jgi:transcriptional regulator with XRE-family HTH domain
MTQTPAPTFGDLLKHIRKRAGMTQSDLAAAVGYSVSFVSVLEQNRRLPDVDEADAVVRSSKVEADRRRRGLAHPRQRTRDNPRVAKVVAHQPFDALLWECARVAEDLCQRHSLQLIGRAQEMRQLCQRLPGHSGRCGAGGAAGHWQTQLALAVAAQLHYHYPDGAAFVALAAVSDAVVDGGHDRRQRGVSRCQPKPPKTKLIEYLRRKTMLLVLDNLEQICCDGSATDRRFAGGMPRLCIWLQSRTAASARRAASGAAA